MTRKTFLTSSIALAASATLPETKLKKTKVFTQDTIKEMLLSDFVDLKECWVTYVKDGVEVKEKLKDLQLSFTQSTGLLIANWWTSSPNRFWAVVRKEPAVNYYAAKVCISIHDKKGFRPTTYDKVDMQTLTFVY